MLRVRAAPIGAAVSAAVCGIVLLGHSHCLPWHRAARRPPWSRGAVLPGGGAVAWCVCVYFLGGAGGRAEVTSNDHGGIAGFVPSRVRRLPHGARDVCVCVCARSCAHALMWGEGGPRRGKDDLLGWLIKFGGGARAWGRGGTGPRALALVQCKSSVWRQRLLAAPCCPDDGEGVSACIAEPSAELVTHCLPCQSCCVALPDSIAPCYALLCPCLQAVRPWWSSWRSLSTSWPQCTCCSGPGARG